MSLLECLKSIPTDHSSPFGICGYVSRAGYPKSEIQNRAKRWPKYSGNPWFPVPSPVPGTSPEAFYISSSDARMNLWDRNTDYGASRWQLVNYIIGELELKEALEAIPEDYHARHGVCRYLYRKGASRRLFLQLANQWPDHSGFYAFPVPSPDPNITPAEYYDLAQDQGLWDKSTPYGQHRHSIINFVKELLQ